MAKIKHASLAVIQGRNVLVEHNATGTGGPDWAEIIGISSVDNPSNPRSDSTENYLNGRKVAVVGDSEISNITMEGTQQSWDPYIQNVIDAKASGDLVTFRFTSPIQTVVKPTTSSINAAITAADEVVNLTGGIPTSWESVTANMYLVINNTGYVLGDPIVDDAGQFTASDTTLKLKVKTPVGTDISGSNYSVVIPSVQYTAVCNVLDASGFNFTSEAQSATYSVVIKPTQELTKPAIIVYEADPKYPAQLKNQ